MESVHIGVKKTCLGNGVGRDWDRFYQSEGKWLYSVLGDKGWVMSRID